MLCERQRNSIDHLTWSSGYFASAKSVDIGKSNTLPFVATSTSLSKTKAKGKTAAIGKIES